MVAAAEVAAAVAAAVVAAEGEAAIQTCECCETRTPRRTWRPAAARAAAELEDWRAANRRGEADANTLQHQRHSIRVRSVDERNSIHSARVPVATALITRPLSTVPRRTETRIGLLGTERPAAQMRRNAAQQVVDAVPSS